LNREKKIGCSLLWIESEMRTMHTRFIKLGTWNLALHQCEGPIAKEVKKNLPSRIQRGTMVHCLITGALRQILGLATFRPRGMKTTRPYSTAHEGERKGVAANELTNTNELPTTNDDQR
jgi:hypothetical protein